MSVFSQLMMSKTYRLNPLIKIVGNPTITKDFIYKNVGANDYIYINEVLPLSTANNWKIQCKIKYDINNNDQRAPSPIIAFYGDNSNDGKSPVLRAEGNDVGGGSQYINKLRALISSVGNSNWNINVSPSDYTFVVGQEYELEYGFTGSKYYVNNFGSEIWSILNSSKCECSNFIALLHNGYRTAGWEYELCSGEMDLKTLKVYINDNLYFRGVL